MTKQIIVMAVAGALFGGTALLQPLEAHEPAATKTTERDSDSLFERVFERNDGN